MPAVIAILVIALIVTAIGWIRTREKAARLGEAVDRLEAEKAEGEAEKPQLSELSSSLEVLGSSFERYEQGEAKRQALLTSVDSKVDRTVDRIDGLANRYSNPKSRSQLSEGWLVGALRRMGLRDGLHFEAQKRVSITGTRNPAEGVIDILLWLPNANGLALDSKFPWSAHLASVHDGDEAAREFAVRQLRDALRNHIKDIARRQYHRAQGVDIRHVFIVVPDWQTLDLVKGVDPQISELASEARIGLLPADGLYEIAAALGELHREEGWGEKVRELFSPADADRMYAACVDVLKRVECVINRHKSTGDAIDDLSAAFGPNGVMGRDILGPAARIAEKVELDVTAEVRELDPNKTERHRDRLEVQGRELRQVPKRPEAA